MEVRLKVCPLLCLACLLAVGNGVWAHVYKVPVDIATWQISSSPLECKLWQSVPRYGDAVFQIKAGEKLKFFLETSRRVQHGGMARVASEPPEWKPGLDVRAIASVEGAAGLRPVNVGQELANELLAELQYGMSPHIEHNGWYEGHKVEVGVSSVNFYSAYQGYLECANSLLPFNFEQLAHHTMRFPFNKWRLSKSQKEILDRMAHYMKADDSVKKIYINGHADSIGRRGYNWELSRKRADVIRQYLVWAGLQAERIGFNYHGEGRPAVKNNSKKNRAVNRRVTLRLVRK